MEQTAVLELIKKEITEIKEKMVTKEDFESIIETWEILHDPETMKRIKKSEEEFIKGKTIKFTDMDALLDEA